MPEKRILVVLENRGYTPKDIPTIKRGLAASGVRASNIRVSRKNVQVDLFLECASRPLEKCVEEALGGLRPLDWVDLSVEHYSGMEPHRILERAVELFNQERFWEFHEALEALWRREPAGPRRELLQAMILVAAAFVHAQKNRQEVALRVLERALRKLASIPKEELKLPPIDLQAFIGKVEAMFQTKNIEPFEL